MSKDYYRVLGVLDDAEDIVIKAAYKALAQRYHPDKWAGDSAEANRRMAEINEAYAVLSDSVKRKEYDSQREKASYQVEPESDDLNSTLQSDWDKVVEYFPDLIGIADGLSKISASLAYSFKVILLELKAFKDRQALAANLEKNYLEKYFGANPEIQLFAKYLITGNIRNAAKELNEAVTLLGSAIDAKIIIDRINLKYQLRYNASLAATISNLMKALASQDTHRVAIAHDLLESLQYSPRANGWFFPSGYLIDEGRVTRVLSDSDLIAFALEVGQKYLRGEWSKP